MNGPASAGDGGLFVAGMNVCFHNEEKEQKNLMEQRLGAIKIREETRFKSVQFTSSGFAVGGLRVKEAILRDGAALCVTWE